MKHLREEEDDEQNKIKKNEKLSRLTIKQRMEQMVYVAYICLGILILSCFTNILYIWKLNGIISKTIKTEEERHFSYTK